LVHVLGAGVPKLITVDTLSENSMKLLIPVLALVKSSIKIEMSVGH
jgi:hypothetical protein